MGFRHLAVGLFADEEMMMATAGNLRQVSDTHDTGRFAQLTQQFAYDCRRRAADTDIYLIEIRAGVSIFRAVMT